MCNLLFLPKSINSLAQGEDITWRHRSQDSYLLQGVNKLQVDFLQQVTILRLTHYTQSNIYRLQKMLQCYNFYIDGVFQPNLHLLLQDFFIENVKGGIRSLKLEGIVNLTFILTYNNFA